MAIDTLKFECTGIPEGGRFPLEHTGRGANRSPEFILEDLSPQAVSLAIVLEDMSHPIRGFTHWLVWNLPAVPKIQGSLPPGWVGDAVQGLAYGWHRYAGPKPPSGHSHTYRFTLYALDCRLELPAWTGKKRFLRAAEGHILQKGVLCAIFE